MMILEKCPTEDELRALSLGILSEEQSDEILGHLPACEPCQSRLATAGNLEDTLASHLRASDQNDFRDEAECQIALAKALGAMAGGQVFGDEELSALLPEILGDYEVVRQIGRGGMGTVYLARHTKLNRQVALKVLSTHRLTQPRMRQRFEAEMRAIGSLSHPNIVTAYDAREVNDLSVLVTEFIDGLDVGQILRRTGNLAICNACEIARQAVLALQYIDEQGLVHRDIKPSNVMVAKQGFVKLLDLGLARLQLDHEERLDMTASGQAMGTADYIAPEQVNDSRHVDIRADIYALGCTLFKMLCGQTPFADSCYPTAFAKMTAHVSDTPPDISTLVPGIPAPLASLIHQMMAKDPAERPRELIEIAGILEQYSTGADLAELVEQALQMQDAAMPLASTTASQRRAQPQPKSILTKTVPLPIAIGGGLLGALLGFCLGVIITIYPDGRVEVKTTDESEGSHTAVAPSIQSNSSPPVASTPLDAKSKPSAKNVTAMDDRQRLQGVWKTPQTTPTGPANTLGSAIIAFAGNHYLTFINGQPAGDMTFDMTSQNKFSTLNINGPQDVSMQAIVSFDGDDRLTLRTQAGSMDLERISHLPLTPSELTKVAENPDTALHAKTVKMIAEYQQTGQFPITPGMLSVLDAARKSESRNKLKTIGIGLHNYLDSYQGFPAASRGKQIKSEKNHEGRISWRVAILPFIGEEKLYEEFHLGEAWDSEHNLKLLSKMPKTYRAPGAETDTTETPYLAIVGPDSVISTTPTIAKELTDGFSNTIMVVETKKAVPWTKPDDIEFATDGNLPILDSPYEGGFNALFADGAVRFVDHGIGKDNIQALFTRNGDEGYKLP